MSIGARGSPQTATSLAPLAMPKRDAAACYDHDMSLPRIQPDCLEWFVARSVLHEARHDLHHVARAMPEVELVTQNERPSVLASAGRAWQAENIGSTRDARERSRLNSGGADFLIAEHVHEHRKAVDFFFEKRPDGLGRNVAACEPGSSRGDDRVDGVICDPGLDLSANLPDIVFHDSPRGKLVAALFNHFGKQVAGFIVFCCASVGNCEHCDPYGFEGKAFIDP